MSPHNFSDCQDNISTQEAIHILQSGKSQLMDSAIEYVGVFPVSQYLHV